MEFALVTSVAAIGLFAAMLVLMDVGRRIGLSRHVHGADGESGGFGTAEGAVLGLLGLVIAFTFNGAGDRFEHRRHMIDDEANAIGTAYWRLDLLSGQARGELQDLFRRYVDLRVATHEHVGDAAMTNRRFEETNTLQREIWSKTLTSMSRPGADEHATMLLLPALNAMFDIEATRSAAIIDHPPLGIFLLLALLGLVAALLVGYAMAGNRTRSWVHMIAFAGIVSVSLFVILEIEFPRVGLIRVDSADRALIDLRHSML